MKINYKNINQTLFENIKNYINLRDNIIYKNNIISAQIGLLTYIQDVLKKKEIIKKIKLSIFVEEDFFSEKCLIGKNIVKSPLFNGYFKVLKNNTCYFFALYNNVVLFYTCLYDYRNRNSYKMERFCERRFLF